MSNKYESMFPDDLTEKQTYFLYCQLLEAVKNDPVEREELFQAHLKASAAAYERDSKRFDELQEEGRREFAKIGMDCILCT